MTEEKTTSFIPKARNTSGRHRAFKYNSFTITGVTIFLLVFLVSAGLFIYEMYLDSRVSAMEAQLPKVDEIFDPEFVKELTVADATIRSSEELLNTRVAPTVIFGLLEDLTAENIYFENFEYSSHQLGGDEGTVVVLEGSAPTFNAVAFQSDVFKNEENIKEATVRNIRLRDGRVLFEATLKMEVKTLLYKENI